MLAPFLIMLREGVEATLILGILATYLARSGRKHLLPAVFAGALVAILCCAALGFAFKAANAEFPQKVQETFEAVVAALAAGLLASMAFWMKRAARGLKGELERAADAARGSDREAFALALAAFIAVGREGVEAVVFLLAIAEQATGYQAALGAALGLLCAMGVGAAIYLGGVRIDMRRFFRVTGIVVLFVAAGLVASALRSAHEAGFWNYLQAPAFDLEAWLPSYSVAGVLLQGIFGFRPTPTIGETLAYLVFLIPAVALFLAPAPSPAPVLRRS